MNSDIGQNRLPDGPFIRIIGSSFWFALGVYASSVIITAGAEILTGQVSLRYSAYTVYLFWGPIFTILSSIPYLAWLGLRRSLGVKNLPGTFFFPLVFGLACFPFWWLFLIGANKITNLESGIVILFFVVVPVLFAEACCQLSQIVRSLKKRGQ